MDFEPAYSRYALASVNQRLGALIVDFLSCWFMAELILSLLSITTSTPLRLFTFIVTWFIFRVFVAARGQGQSFGRWLMSIRVIDAEFGKTASLGAFLKREIFVFACSLFLIETITSTFIVFAWIPFAADAAFAVVDNEKRQAFHDRLSRTISIQSRKGFQIDQKLGKLLNIAGRQASDFYQERQEERSASRQGRYGEDYEQPRRPKRRPRSKSRPPQDFYNDRGDQQTYGRSYGDSYGNDIDDNFADDLRPDALNVGYVDDYEDRYRSDNFTDDFPDSYGSEQSDRSLGRDDYDSKPKRSARRPRRGSRS
jgi:uncharacterized RDD family membrane protein YckC